MNGSGRLRPSVVITAGLSSLPCRGGKVVGGDGGRVVVLVVVVELPLGLLVGDAEVCEEQAPRRSASAAIVLTAPARRPGRGRPAGATDSGRLASGAE